MTRRHKPTARKKQGGVLMGMRSGVQKVAGTVSGGAAVRDDKSERDGAPKKPSSKVWTLIGNIISGVLIVVAIAVFLRRCGIVHF